MTTDDLAKNYLNRSVSRIKMLKFLLEEEAYPDTIRESQETVELLLKAVLRSIGIDPPKVHDVSKALIEAKELFSPEFQNHLDRIQSISRYLRKERELSFYGEIDFIPSENYGEEEAKRAVLDTEFIYNLVKKEIVGRDV